MDCDRNTTLLNAYIDGELDLSSTLTLEGHLAGCRSCKDKYGRLADLTADLRNGLERYPAPSELRERVTLMLAARPASSATTAAEAAGGALVVMPMTRRGGDQGVGGRKWGRRQFLALAASIAGVAVVSGATTYWLMPRGEAHGMADEVVASHIRSLMASHLTDIASADQHTVKPWFDGKVDVAPTVADYSNQGFALMGGRLDYLDRRPVAALVYRHRAHLINMFACPVRAGEERETKPEALSIRGYNVLYWTAGDVTYWAVSDASPADLQTFRNLVQEATDSRG
ncbi:MAG TPA: anti-sigma factor [Terriglobia bacterium]|nr:anti-sigma factor [Terriglobia bacterium]